MNASLIIKALGVLTALVSAQIALSPSAIASEAAGQPSDHFPALSSFQTQAAGLKVELQQFVPPDTGGPDQSGGTGTR